VLGRCSGDSVVFLDWRSVPGSSGIEVQGLRRGRYYVEALPAVNRGADLAQLNYLEQASNRLESLPEIEALRASLPSNLV
jgi:hypothetical protein